MKFSYSFSLPAPTAQPTPEQLHPYDYNEFVLSLSADWRQVPISRERTLRWCSDKLKAEIIVSVDFYELPESKWAKVAEVTLESRHKALAEASGDALTVVSRSAKPYSGGGGLEISYAAHTGDMTHIYLGYVTSRKVFNFSLTGGANKAALVELYNRLMERQLRVKVP
ncbi:hypothetical protein ABIC63_005977 [Pseudacidovorax sp. 1753]|uniref:hypothetical protein n=1 Tax=Pseudacidovorax sp. 1753 TaxID=3156419 RepID=UPI0033991B81